LSCFPEQPANHKRHDERPEATDHNRDGKEFAGGTLQGTPEPKPDVGRQHGNDSGGQPEATGEPMNEECVALLMKTSSRNPKAPSLMVAAFQAPAKEPKRRLSVDY
jgi:hypothetical protein